MKKSSQEDTRESERNCGGEGVKQSIAKKSSCLHYLKWPEVTQHKHIRYTGGDGMKWKRSIFPSGCPEQFLITHTRKPVSGHNEALSLNGSHKLENTYDVRVATSGKASYLCSSSMPFGCQFFDLVLFKKWRCHYPPQYHLRC